MPGIRLNLNKEEFVAFRSGHTINETAKYFNMGTSSVSLYAKKWIEKEILPNELTSIQNEVIIGSLLGDGSITKTNYNASFQEGHCEKQLDYLIWKQEVLKPFSTSINKIYKSKVIKINGKCFQDHSKKVPYYRMITHASPIFTELNKKWYLRDGNDNYILNKKGERIKIIPLDLKLTPLTLAIWFYDDGCWQPQTRSVEIATQSFSKEENEFLLNKIKNFKIEAYINSNNIIVIRRHDALNFINIISGQVLVECMNYKTDLSDYKTATIMYGETHPSAKLKEKQVLEIIKLGDQGHTVSQIAKIYGRSRGCIYAIINRIKWKQLTEKST